MTGLLQHHDEDSFVRCSLCGADAAGPCARCHRPVCGDCCVLVEGAHTQWAVCTRCEKNEGQSLGGWLGLGVLFGKVLLGLVAVLLFLAWLAGDLG